MRTLRVGSRCCRWDMWRGWIDCRCCNLRGRGCRWGLMSLNSIRCCMRNSLMHCCNCRNWGGNCCSCHSLGSILPCRRLLLMWKSNFGRSGLCINCICCWRGRRGWSKLCRLLMNYIAGSSRGRAGMRILTGNILSSSQSRCFGRNMLSTLRRRGGSLCWCLRGRGRAGCGRGRVGGGGRGGLGTTSGNFKCLLFLNLPSIIPWKPPEKGGGYRISRERAQEMQAICFRGRNLDPKVRSMGRRGLPLLSKAYQTSKFHLRKSSKKR